MKEEMRFVSTLYADICQPELCIKKTQIKTICVFFTEPYNNTYLYFLKKSGILIDCYFTLLVGVLGVSSDGVVPPTGLLGTVAPVPTVPVLGVTPISALGD